MDKSKISTMFDKFLVQLLAAEAIDDEEDVEGVEQPKLFEAPDGGWKNKYDEYMFNLANQIMTDYGLDREATMEVVLGVAGVLVERKHLPAIPKGQVEAEIVTKWVEAAEKIGFAKHVLGMTDKIMREAVKEVGDTDTDTGNDDE